MVTLCLCGTFLPNVNGVLKRRIFLLMFYQADHMLVARPRVIYSSP